MATPEGLRLSSDEIEVACDFLWFARRETRPSPEATRLWDRLQPIRHGDYGGDAATELTRGEAGAVLAAADFAGSRVAHDEDERALAARLRSSLRGEGDR